VKASDALHLYLAASGHTRALFHPVILSSYLLQSQLQYLLLSFISQELMGTTDGLGVGLVIGIIGCLLV